MSNMHAVAEQLKARLNAQAAAQAPAESGLEAGKPAPGSQQAPPPIQQPAAVAITPPAAAPAAPAAPPAQPAVDVAALQRQLADLQASNQALASQVQTLRTAPPQPVEIKLPPKEQLDAMPQSELAEYIARQVAGHTMAAVQSQLSALEQQQIAPLTANLNAVRQADAERALRGRFPRLDLEKYRPAFEAKLAGNRSLSFEDAIRLVADPADLMPGDPAMTSAQPVGAGVHMETGVPSRTAASSAPASKEPSEAELVALASQARERGDTFNHRRYMQMATKVRLGFTG